MLNTFSNDELRNLFSKCELGEKIQESDQCLLSAYNDIFDTKLGHLHHYMIQELKAKLIEEMAKRFYNF